MQSDGEHNLVRKHGVFFLPPGIDHAISNTGSPTSSCVTLPVTDDAG